MCCSNRRHLTNGRRQREGRRKMTKSKELEWGGGTGIEGKSLNKKGKQTFRAKSRNHGDKCREK
jgi:hypothetical protein